MRSGRLDRFITIQRKTQSYSDSGEPQETWATLDLRRPASYHPLRGDERFTGDQVVGSEQVEFSVLYSNNVSDLSQQDRIIYPALNESVEPVEVRRIYDIHDVSEIGRREGVRIVATRRQDASS